VADDASIMPAVRAHALTRPPTAKARRALLETALDRLLGAVDGLLEDLDALDGDADQEPSLGLSEIDNLHYGISLDQRHLARGATDGREAEHDGREPDVEDEPSFGWTADESAGTPHRWSSPTDGEQSLAASDAIDQRHWVHPQSAELRCHDREEQCEDEGGACEDEGGQDDREPEGHGGGCIEYADGGHDQTRLDGHNVPLTIPGSPLFPSRAPV
jgi:hypothetical protein